MFVWSSAEQLVLKSDNLDSDLGKRWRPNELLMFCKLDYFASLINLNTLFKMVCRYFLEIYLAAAWCGSDLNAVNNNVNVVSA